MEIANSQNNLSNILEIIRILLKFKLFPWHHFLDGRPEKGVAEEYKYNITIREEVDWSHFEGLQ